MSSVKDVIPKLRQLDPDVVAVIVELFTYISEEMAVDPCYCFHHWNQLLDGFLQENHHRLISDIITEMELEKIVEDKLNARRQPQ